MDQGVPAAPGAKGRVVMLTVLRRLYDRFWPAQRTFEQGLEPHSPPLDGLRGVAVLLVLMYDCLKLVNDGSPVTLLARKTASAGWIGVDLFFVLSGFLITGILLETRGRAGYWRSFIIRRSVRIFPLYYATLAVVFLVIPSALWWTGSWNSFSRLAQVHEDQFYYWVYLQNWLFAARQSWPHERVLNHFWSLAVEEQFYLVWPIVVAWFSRTSLVRLCFALCVTALGLRCLLIAQGADPVTTYVMTITRMDSLCLGALVAVGLRNERVYRRCVGWLPVLTAGTLALLVGIDVVWPVLESQAVGSSSIGHTLIGLFFACLIATLATVPRGHLLYTAASALPLRILGKYSYAIYVFHRFAHELVMTFDWNSLPEWGRGWGEFAATLALSVGIAKLTWVLLEQPCLSLKKYAPRPDQVKPREPLVIDSPAPKCSPTSEAACVDVSAAVSSSV